MIPQIDKRNSGSKPGKCPLEPDSIPKQLKKIAQWTCWKWVWHNNKWTKPPCDPQGNISSHTTSNYTFKQVLKGYTNNESIAGIGFSMRETDDICGIDIDSCIDEAGNLTKQARKIIKLAGSYHEISPSGKGIRIFGLGKPATRGSRPGDPLEIYHQGRYLTVTGAGQGKLKNIEAACAKIADLYPRPPETVQQPNDGGGFDEQATDRLQKLMMLFSPHSYETWIKCGQVIHHETDGSEHGLQVWEGWSMMSSKFQPGECAKKWRSFGKNPVDPITIASLIYAAKKERVQEGIIGGEVMTWEQLSALKMPPKKFYLEPWLPQSSICMVHAKRGLGKTNLCLGIALAVAAGKEFLRWKATKPRRVLYIDGELPLIDLQSQVLLAQRAISFTPATEHLLFLTPDRQPNQVMPDLSTQAGRDWCDGFIEEFRPHLIIIDSLATCFRSAEHKQENWKEPQEWLLKLRSCGKSILLIHHDEKTGKSQRGFSNKEDVMNTVLHLKTPPGYEQSLGAVFNVIFTKARGLYGDAVKAFEARLETDPNNPLKTIWTTNLEEQTTYDKVVKMFKEGEYAHDICKYLELTKGTISKYKKKALENGDLTSADIQTKNNQWG